MEKEKIVPKISSQLAHTPKPIKNPTAIKSISSAKKQILKNETVAHEQPTKQTFHEYLFETYVKTRLSRKYTEQIQVDSHSSNETKEKYDIEKLMEFAHINLNSKFLLYVNEWIDCVKLAMKLKQTSSHLDLDEYKMFDYFERLHDYYLQNNVQAKKLEFIAEFHTTFAEFLKLLFHTSFWRKSDEKKKDVTLLNNYWTNLIQRIETILEFCDQKECKSNANVLLSLNLSFLKTIQFFLNFFSAEIYKTRAKDWFLYSKLFKFKEENLFFVLNKFETFLVNNAKNKRFNKISFPWS